MACNKFFRRPHFSLSHTYTCNLKKSSEINAIKQILNKSSWKKSYNVSSQSYFSTVFYSNTYSQKKHNLKPINYRPLSALFLSSQSTNDSFQVVVTNPLNPSAEFSSDISKIEEVSKVLSESGNTIAATDTPSIAATLFDELQTASEVIEPSLASLGLANHTPVGLVQVILEYMHINMHMPWWAAIATCTVIARILLLPLLIKTQRNTVTMANHMPQLQFLQTKFGEARRSGNTMEASRYASEIMQFMKEHNISPLKNAMLPMAQAPVFLSFFLALRGMAKTPVESMKVGGIWWATDLTIPDPYYVMPIVACGTLYIVLKVGAESGIKLENMKMTRYFLQALPVVALPFCINFPSAVLFYWCTTNFCTLLIVSILKIPPVRVFLKLPKQQPIDPKFKTPKKSFIAGVKEAFEDQKALAAVEDRKRMDNIRFQKAGTGPIPRTYSYDPTKVRPSNVAAAVREAVSAKEHKT